MKPWLRNSLIGVGALIVLLVIGAAVLIATFDANRFKGLAIDYMKNERQRTLVIDGPIELSVFPRIAVKVSKLKLSEHRRADEFLAIDEAALAVQTLPLLRKQLVVDRVSARGVRALYTRDANGKSNIDDLTAAPADPNKPAAPAPAGGGAALRFDISAVTLDDLALTIRDAMTPLEGRVAVQSLKTGRLANQGETPVSLRATLDLSKPQPIKLALDGNTTLALDLDKNVVRLSGMKLDTQLDGAGFKELALTASGTLGWDGSAVRAGPLKLDIKRGTRDALTLSPSSLEVKQLLFSTAGQKLELDALKLALAGRQGADAPFELALEWPQLAVDASSLKGSALSGQVKLSGPTSLNGRVPIGRTERQVRCAQAARRVARAARADAAAQDRWHAERRPARQRRQGRGRDRCARPEGHACRPRAAAVAARRARQCTRRRQGRGVEARRCAERQQVRHQRPGGLRRQAQHPGAGPLRQPRPQQGARAGQARGGRHAGERADAGRRAGRARRPQRGGRQVQRQRWRRSRFASTRCRT